MRLDSANGEFEKVARCLNELFLDPVKYPMMFDSLILQCNTFYVESQSSLSAGTAPSVQELKNSVLSNENSAEEQRAFNDLLMKTESESTSGSITVGHGLEGRDSAIPNGRLSSVSSGGLKPNMSGDDLVSMAVGAATNGEVRRKSLIEGVYTTDRKTIKKNLEDYIKASNTERKQ